MILPSKMTTEQLREHCERAIAHGQQIMVSPPDLLALLVALDLRERLDRDVQACAKNTKAICEHQLEDYPTDQLLKERLAAAERVLAHQPLPVLGKVPREPKEPS